MKNKFLKIGMLVAAVALASFESKAQVLYGNARVVINSNASTNLVVNYPFFPTFASSSTSVTNLVAITLPYGWNQMAIQVQGQSTNGTATSNVVWTVYKSVTGGSVTNAVGTGLLYDTLGYITNTLSGAATVAANVAVYSVDQRTATTSQSADTGLAGIPTIYLGVITVPAASGYTNFQAIVNIK